MNEDKRDQKDENLERKLIKSMEKYFESIGLPKGSRLIINPEVMHDNLYKEKWPGEEK